MFHATLSTSSLIHTDPGLVLGQVGTGDQTGMEKKEEERERVEEMEWDAHQDKHGGNVDDSKLASLVWLRQLVQ